ncbi:MAG: RNA polymerase sigma factor [Gemmatimonadetes bacterium]|nr:RNA polymerase sigma factor [Gemmatimonadota bacterium]MBT6150029.1 RNA polymerase sigma factor [Gemmatimonadota bacterium]MBT7859497.1 RNA polymerase sigma factor [Gemmatimonadota bacterium]
MKELIQAGYGYALSLTHAAVDAEDLVHDAWLRLAHRGERRPARALLFTTIRHLYIDTWRRQQRVPHESFDESAYPTLDLPEDHQLDQIDLTRALGRIRPEEREAIYLQSVQRYTAAETAKLMDMPRGTVLSLIHRGKSRLRRILCDPIPPEEAS